MRITFDCAAMHSTGYAMASMLREFGIECEYADEYKCVLLFGYGTTDIDFETIKTVLKANGPRTLFERQLPLPPMHIMTQTVCQPSKAYFGEKVRMPLDMAVGKTCASVTAPCPPGIPLLMPGEAVTPEAASVLKERGLKEIMIMA